MSVSFILYINTVFDKSDFYKLVLIYRKVEDQKTDHNISDSPYVFRMRRQFLHWNTIC
jgi:hypothetical protein